MPCNTRLYPLLKSLLQNHLTAGTDLSPNIHSAECIRGASTQCAAQRTKSGAISVPVQVYSNPKLDVSATRYTSGVCAIQIASYNRLDYHVHGEVSEFDSEE